MEDCVDKNESLLSLSNLKPGENVNDTEEKTLINGEGERAEGHGENNGSAGFIETVATKLGFVSSSEGNNGEEEKGERNGEKKEEEKEESNGGGFIETVANKLGFGSSSEGRAREEELEERNGEKRRKTEESNEGGGIIETVATKLGFSTQNPNQENGGEKNEVHGIVDQIMSKLPESRPVSEDRVPDADEASLLIAIIDD